MVSFACMPTSIYSALSIAPWTAESKAHHSRACLTSISVELVVYASIHTSTLKKYRVCTLGRERSSAIRCTRRASPSHEGLEASQQSTSDPISSKSCFLNRVLRIHHQFRVCMDCTQETDLHKLVPTCLHVLIDPWQNIAPNGAGSANPTAVR